jgi:hypothetical protein
MGITESIDKLLEEANMETTHQDRLDEIFKDHCLHALQTYHYTKDSFPFFREQLVKALVSNPNASTKLLNDCVRYASSICITGFCSNIVLNLLILENPNLFETTFKEIADILSSSTETSEEVLKLLANSSSPFISETSIGNLKRRGILVENE